MKNKTIFIVFLLLSITSAIAQKTKKNLAQAISYINTADSITLSSYNIRLLGVWLQKQYKMPMLFRPDMLNYCSAFEEDAPIYNFYNSLIGLPNKFDNDSLSHYFAKANDLERVLVWATNAEMLPFDTACQRIARSYTTPDANIRQSAHIALAFHWAEKTMHSPARVFFSMYKQELAQALVNGIHQEPDVNDNWLEGIMGLICLNRRDLVPQGTMPKILNAQNTDGGWAWNRLQSPNSHPHPTILAIWILADYEANKKLYR